MEPNDFLKKCNTKGYTQEDLHLFKKALILAQEHLGNKIRLAGDSFFEHNIRVAFILVENNSPPEIVIAALLHSLLKYTDVEKINEEFGKEIVELLKGTAELNAIKIKNKQIEPENLRKIFLTTLKDVRVIIIKLANKLDNLQSIHVFPPEEQKRMAEEVLEIYAPLASRLGVEKIKTELENTAFSILNPKKYQEIVNFLEESQEEREQNIHHAIDLITKSLEGKVNLIKIKGRPKHIYSIYRKMKEKGINLKDQFDLLGVRVIVQEIKDCYIALGLLHEHFEPVEGRLKDYITNPKPNLYRSIHTAIYLPNKVMVEVQIRTLEMDEFAEEGLAAHWRYKGIKSDQLFEKKIAWLRNILDLQKKTENKELLETVKVDLFGDNIYCYTPKGDVKELPKGATLLDFAYLVHQDLGDHCIGGRVNGKFVPIKHFLNTGDIIEILTNKSQRPRRSWLKIVYSARAKQKIRKSLKEHEMLPAMHYAKLKPVQKEEEGVLVQSLENPEALCILAKCCNPIPNETITGFVTKKRIISVHKQECHVAIKEEERWQAVSWRDTFNQKIRFNVAAQERSGLLADVLHTIASAGFEVKEAKAKLIDLGNVLCSFVIIPRDLEQLKEMIRRVKKVRGWKKIYFE